MGDRLDGGRYGEVEQWNQKKEVRRRGFEGNPSDTTTTRNDEDHTPDK